MWGRALTPDFSNQSCSGAGTLIEVNMLKRNEPMTYSTLLPKSILRTRRIPKKMNFKLNMNAKIWWWLWSLPQQHHCLTFQDTATRSFTLETQITSCCTCDRWGLLFTHTGRMWMPSLSNSRKTPWKWTLESLKSIVTGSPHTLPLDIWHYYGKAGDELSLALSQSTLHPGKTSLKWKNRKNLTSKQNHRHNSQDPHSHRVKNKADFIREDPPRPLHHSFQLLSSGSRQNSKKLFTHQQVHSSFVYLCVHLFRFILHHF